MRNIEIGEIRNRILLEDLSSRSYLVIRKLKFPFFVGFGLKIARKMKIGRNDEMNSIISFDNYLCINV